MSNWRYIAQRVLTGEILEWELPIARDELSWELSGAGSFRGTVSPDTARLRAADGRLLLEEWGTLLYAEADGEIRWGGIVMSSKFNGAAWSVEAAGFSAYAHGLPYGGAYTGVAVDPATVIGAIWSHIQSYPHGNLGLTVKGSTPVRIGTASDTAAADAATAAASAKADYTAEQTELTTRRASLAAARKDYSAKLAARTAANKALSAAKKTGNAGAIAAAQAAYNAAVADATAAKSVITTREAAVASQVATVKTLKTAYDKANASKKTAAKAAKGDGGAYKLNWWETPDCGQEINSLASETPFDLIERHYWDGEAIKHEIQVAYPRAGRRRDDLAFIQGGNIADVVTPEIQGDGFANEVLGIGAGENKGTLRRTIAVRDGRLRRSHVYAAKDVRSPTRLDSMIRSELQRRLSVLDITEVTVREHPNAPIGSWTLGDDVLIQATLPWLGDVELWCRITGWSLISDTTARLSLRRSDAFNYGG